jgi:hypothetical protein
MLRHTALFRLRKSTTPGERETMLRGLASLLDECPTVRAGDYGESLFPGPHAPNDYDVALHLDFDDAEGYAAYVDHPTHVAVAAFNASLAVDSSTVRIDWLYDGPARVSAQRVRHCEVFVWAADADRARALAAASSLGAEAEVVSAVAALDAGGDPRASDWILDLELRDAQAARMLLDGEAYRSFVAAAAPAVDASRTARITHLERAG